MHATSPGTFLQAQHLVHIGYLQLFSQPFPKLVNIPHVCSNPLLHTAVCLGPGVQMTDSEDRRAGTQTTPIQDVHQRLAKLHDCVHPRGVEQISTGHFRHFRHDTMSLSSL